MDAVEADPAPLRHRAADHPSQDVAAALVRRRDAVADQEGHPASVVGQDAVCLRRLGGVAVGDAGLGRDPLHDQLIAVGVVDRRNLLQDPRASLETEPRVDVLLRERHERAVGLQLVLHEDEVPELEEPLAARAAGQAVGRAAAHLRAPVVVDLRVGPAGPGAADGPEVLRGGQRHDALGRHADGLPQIDRDLVGPELQLGVTRVDADPEPVPVEPHPLLHELRRELDRTLLEVLPEREVPEHLEEGEVIRVEADLLDVRCPKDLLHRRRERRRRRLETEEVRHLRLHARRS